MVLKVYFENVTNPESELLHPIDGEQQSQSNVRVRVKNTDTLEEFRGESYCNPKYFEKINQWIKKRKYDCKMLNNNSEMELKVEIFKFPLKKVPKSDVEILKQEICSMRKENSKLRGELKMFRYYFLNQWKDRSRIVIAEKPDLKQELIESSQNLYDQMKTEGIILEEFGSKVYYLKIQMQSGLSAVNTIETSAFQQQNSFSGTPGGTPMGGTQTGGAPISQVCYQVQGRDYGATLQDLIEQNQNQGFLEVFITGGAYNFQKACLNTQRALEGGELSSLLQINMPIEESVSYTVFIPRKLQ